MLKMEVFLPLSLNVKRGQIVNVKYHTDGLYHVFVSDIEIGLGKSINENKKLKSDFQGKVLSCKENTLIIRVIEKD